MFTRTLCIALSLASLSGCTQYRYIQPDTAEGRQCVKDLDDRVYACQKNAEDSTQGQRVIYDAQMRSYQDCLHNNPRDTQGQSMCASPPMEPKADTAYCRHDYDYSFAKCGGIKEAIPTQ